MLIVPTMSAPLTLCVQYAVIRVERNHCAVCFWTQDLPR